MTQEIESFRDIVPGSIIVNKGSGLSYIVIENRINHLIAVRSVTVTNKSEWVLFNHQNKER